MIDVEDPNEDYYEEDIDVEDELELWVYNIAQIFKTIDEDEFISAKDLNFKFNKLLEICSRMVNQIRIARENIRMLDEKLRRYKEADKLIDSLNNPLTEAEQKEIDTAVQNIFS